MNTYQYPPDKAAILGAAMSLYAKGHGLAEECNANLSAEYEGIDQFMRLCMEVAEKFEAWACQHVDFEQLTEPWPYLLGDAFGNAVFEIFGLIGLKLMFSNTSCRQVAHRMNLTIKP